MLKETSPLELGPAPCDDCRHRERCATTGEACVRFSQFYKGVAEHRWRLMPNQPRADIGARLGLSGPDLVTTPSP